MWQTSKRWAAGVYHDSKAKKKAAAAMVPPPGYEVKLLKPLRPYANQLVNTAAALELGALWMSDVAALRAMFLAGSGFLFAYYLVQKPPLAGPAAWTGLTLALNGTMLVKLLLQRAEHIEFSPLEFEVFQENFAPFGIPAWQFKKLLALGEWRQASAGEVLATSGAEIQRVMLVAHGTVRASDGPLGAPTSTPLPHLDAWPGRAAAGQGAKGGAGAWIGELGLLDLINTDKKTSALVAAVSRSDDGDAPSVVRNRGIVVGGPAAYGDEDVQAKLAALGFYRGPIDGRLEAKRSTDAIRRFQEAAGIRANGEAGFITRAALGRTLNRFPADGGPLAPGKTQVDQAGTKMGYLATRTCVGEEGGGAETARVHLVQWDLDTLVAALHQDPELKGDVRKAVAASAVKKVVAAHRDWTPHQSSSRATAGSVGAQRSEMKTGTSKYMSLYPDESTDGGLRLGNVVPDFSAETTQGKWGSFHEWKKGKWAILFSHPADFTPVCTTEIGHLALKYDELKAMDCLVATLSVDPVKSHVEWLEDVVALFEKKIEINFPIIGDADRAISLKYGMIDAGTSKDQPLPLTTRTVFVVNPENKLMLSLNYPACVGRNMDEIIRCVKALQLSYEKSIATPANWPNNHSDMLLADGSRTGMYKGGVFLLPTVSKEEADETFPGYHTFDVPSKVPYLRLVKLGDVVDVKPAAKEVRVRK